MRKQFSTMYCMKIQFLFFDFDLGGNLESFSKLEVTVHRHVANLWQMQLKAFVRSVRIVPKTLLLSTFFYLTICLSSKKGILCTNCFPKPSWNLENILSKWFGSCFHISFSKSLETTGKVLMGLYLSLWFLEASLKQVLHLHM